MGNQLDAVFPQFRTHDFAHAPYPDLRASTDRRWKSDHVLDGITDLHLIFGSEQHTTGTHIMGFTC